MTIVQDLRYALRALAQEPRLRGPRHPHARARHRRQRGDLLRGRCGALPAAARPRARPARSRLRHRREGPGALQPLLPRLHGLSRRRDGLRGPRGLLGLGADAPFDGRKARAPDGRRRERKLLRDPGHAGPGRTAARARGRPCSRSASGPGDQRPPLANALRRRPGRGRAIGRAERASVRGRGSRAGAIHRREPRQPARRLGPDGDGRPGAAGLCRLPPADGAKSLLSGRRGPPQTRRLDRAGAG